MAEYDIVIRNGKVVDGTGAPWFRADVAIKGEKIVKVKPSILGKGAVEIDATDLMVAPGFWDLHSHDDFVYPVKNHPDMLEGKIRQGITTQVTGNCGYSPFPVSEDAKAYCSFLDAGLTWEWKNLDEYISILEEQGIIMNIVPNVGQGAIRLAVMGFAPGDANPEQLSKMKSLVEETMKQGAFGLTTGLLYPPGFFCTTEELIELAKVVAKYGGFYGSHLRGESEMLLDSVREIIRVGEEAKIPVHIHHHEAWGKKHFWKVPVTIGMIEEARNIRGVDITYDLFPYSGANTTILAVYPPWALEGGVPAFIKRAKDPALRAKMLKDIETGRESHNIKSPDYWPHNIGGQSGWDGILVIWVKSKKNKWAEGKTLAELGKEKGKHPFDVCTDLAVEEEGAVMCIYFGSSSTKEEDYRGEGMITYMKHPYAAAETDAILGKPLQHPAAWGMTARVIGRYARDMKIFTIEEAVRKLTSLPAHRVNVQDRGIIREGTYADICVFNPETIIDTATYLDPLKPPIGIEYVLVNGKVVLEKGDYHKDVLAGKVLRGPGYTK